MDGVKVEERDQIKKVEEDFYRKLLGSSSNQFDGQKAGRLEQLLNRNIADSVRADMVKEVSAEEIRKTIFSMKSSKVPGPNGFSAGPFQKAWPIIGEDVIVAIKSFFCFK